MTFSIGDLDSSEKCYVILHEDCHVQITYNLTGCGTRRFFQCPYCNRRCSKLHYYQSWWYCQACAPFRLYTKRQDLYEGGRELVRWHMDRLLRKNGLRNLHHRSRYMRKTRFEIVKEQYRRLCILYEILIFSRYTISASFVKYWMNDTQPLPPDIVSRCAVESPRYKRLFY